MSHAGIDFDTHAVHLVILEDSGAAVYHHFELAGADAFDRTRSVRDALPARSAAIWDEVEAIGIEEPAGKLTGRLFRVQGAVLACLPPKVLVEKLMPSQWRKACGLPGNAAKEDVWSFAHLRRLGVTKHETAYIAGSHGEPMHVRFRDRQVVYWPQDACDAYCLALAISRLAEPVPSEMRVA